MGMARLLCKQILKSQPIESATILQINGIWFRNTTDATPGKVVKDTYSISHSYRFRV